MKGDFTRLTHDATKRYTGVLKQQGRVDLDADWNEQVAIEEHLRETANIDVIGHCGIPIHAEGFRINDASGGADLTISPGRIYVDGILCELDSPTTYLRQPDLLDPPPLLDPDPGRTDLVYLDVWQRHITALEDADIREKALGGPDTTTRIKTVWQVKVEANVDADRCDDLEGIDNWPPIPPLDVRGCLSTGADPAGTDEPCIIAPGGGYRGLENRLYRVEIHQGGEPGEATFKWSRDNGTVVYGIESFDDDEHTVTVRQIGEDEVLALHIGDWIEVLGDDTELRNTPGIMAQILPAETDLQNLTVRLSENVSAIAGERNPKLRRWDQADGEIPVSAARHVVEDGIWIEFPEAETRQFHTGDYWVFAARTATGEVESLADAPPRGIEHHYCPLALITWQGGEAPPVVQQCCPSFPPLTELPRTTGGGLCTVTLGVDGVTDLAEAVNRLPEQGGCICIPAGIWTQTRQVTIARRSRVTIKGCGRASEIGYDFDEPLFIVRNSHNIAFQDFAVNASTRAVFWLLNGNRKFIIQGCHVRAAERLLLVGGEGDYEVDGLFVRHNFLHTTAWVVQTVGQGSLTNARLESNTIAQNGGMHFEGLSESADVIVAYNRMSATQTAIHIGTMESGALLTLTENLIDAGGQGIQVNNVAANARLLVERNQISTGSQPAIEVRTMDSHALMVLAENQIDAAGTGICVGELKSGARLVLEENRLISDGVAVVVVGTQNESGEVHVNANVFQSRQSALVVLIGGVADEQHGVDHTLFSNNQVYSHGILNEVDCTVQLNGQRLIVMGNYVADAQGDWEEPPGTSICLPKEPAAVTAIGNITGNGIAGEGTTTGSWIIVNNAVY